MADTIRVGIIGGKRQRLGRTRPHAGNGGRYTRRRTHGCLDDTPGVGRRGSRQVRRKVRYDNHHDLLANPDIDVAAVAVKLPTHHELTKNIIAAGKHVYTEWPLGQPPSKQRR